MSCNWKKGGNIFNLSRAQLPVAVDYVDYIRIYYSDRINGKSLPFWVEVDKKNFSLMRRSNDPILNLGKRGSFDWSGVMPTFIMRKEELQFMYYIGWSQRLDVPYHNNLGLALSRDNGNSWEKYSDGPIFSTSATEPGYIGTCDIIEKDGYYLMYYLSCREWIEDSDKIEPVYDIKISKSFDGIYWIPLNITALPLEEGEGGISSSRVIMEGNRYSMYFSVRGLTGYREDINKSYRIKKAISLDGIKWERIDGIEIDVSDDEWENFMVCYPFLIEEDDSFIMFYNGNGFGNTGIGYARKNK